MNADSKPSRLSDDHAEDMIFMLREDELP